MISKFGRWFGGSILIGALALGSTGAAAPQHRTPVATPEPPQCVCTPAAPAAAFNELGDELDGLALDLDAANLASEEISAALAGQDAQVSPEGQSFQVFSSSSAWLGIRMEEITSAKAKELNLPVERGVLVTSVAEDSPAAKVGLKVGDVITDFEGQRVEGTLTLQRLVRETPVGRTVSIVIWRDGQSKPLSVELASRRSARSVARDSFYVSPHLPDMQIAIPPIPPVPPIEIGPFGAFRLFGAPTLGIDAEDLSGQLGNYFGAPDGQGVLVREVMPGLPAEKAGLKAGDVIIRIDGKRVKDASELRDAVRDKLSKASEGEGSEKSAAPRVDLTILRSGKESVIRVELESPKTRTRTPAHRVAV